jgi:hypothetical protein
MNKMETDSSDTDNDTRPLKKTKTGGRQKGTQNKSVSTKLALKIAPKNKPGPKTKVDKALSDKSQSVLGKFFKPIPASRRESPSRTAVASASSSREATVQVYIQI